jgi:hypothetical protein
MKLFREQETFRIVVIAVMMASLASAAGEAASRLVAGFDPVPMVVLAFLVCLEGIATDRLARQLPDADARIRLRVVEWVVILFLLRLVLSLSQGLEGLALAVSHWLARPQNLFDNGLLAGGILLFLIWFLGLKMAQSLEALGPEADSPPPKDSAAYYAWLTRPRADSRGEGWERLVQLFLVGGMLLLLFSALARVDLGSVLTLSNPAIAGIVGNALLYFGLGFLLLAQGHYAALRARWEQGRVPVAPTLTGRWVALGLTFVAVLAVLVLLLPVRPSLALFGAVFDAVWVAFSYVTGAVLIVFGLLAYLLALLGSLLGVRGAEGGAAPEFRLDQVVSEPAPQGVSWWQAVQGLVLWALIVGVLVYALSRFVRERRELLAGLAARGGPLRWLAGVLSALWRWLGGVREEVGVRWRALVSRPSEAGGRGGRGRRLAWFRPHNVRERVRLLYLVALQHTAQRGWPRAAQDTPYEYLRRLTPQLPEAEGDLETLTQAFVEARYSQREFAAEEVGPLRSALQRLHRACRRIVDSARMPGSAERTERQGQ